jgi:S-formylglutathione hydrolase FrmB
LIHGSKYLHALRHSFVVFLFLNLFLMQSNAWAAKVDTLEIYSNSMRKVIRCIVITPSSYKPTAKPYPVLYLLHGWSGNYSSWLTDAPQLTQHADEYQMIIVCPDGGYDSWYLNSPVDSTMQYETHIAKEVVTHIDYYYHTIASKAGRAIAGLSMGGHGALYLTIRHPEVFGAAGSMCGGLDLRPFRKNEWDLKQTLGDPSDFFANWEKYSVVPALPNLANRKTALILDCGVGDFFLNVNRAAHQKLLDMGYPHEYTERPGEHNAAYWGNAIDYQVVFFHKFFTRG